MSAFSAAGKRVLAVIAVPFTLCAVLSALQVALYSQYVSAGAVGDFIAHAAADLWDPYTGKPFRWDTTLRAVTFEVGADRDKPLVPWSLQRWRAADRARRP